MSKSSSEQIPTQMPPANLQSKKTTSAQATPLDNISAASAAGVTSSSSASAPSKALPAATNAGTSGGAAGTTWNNSANINALWIINQDKNSWAGVANVGWLKLSNASDSGIVSLTQLASHAKQMGSTVYYRQEDDGMIHEFYVW